MKVQLNLKAINQIMTSAKVRSVVSREARRMANSAGPGFEAVDRPHKWTARSYVQTDGQEGARRQADEKVLERVVTEKSG
jgi:hypothetical protein